MYDACCARCDVLGNVCVVVCGAYVCCGSSDGVCCMVFGVRHALCVVCVLSGVYCRDACVLVAVWQMVSTWVMWVDMWYAHIVQCMMIDV